MDSVIKVRRSFLNCIRGVLRAFTCVCDDCHRGVCDCFFSSELARAKEGIVMIDNARDAEEERFYVAHPSEDLFRKVVLAVRQGEGRPVAARNIRIPGVSRQRKYKAIKAMLRRGILRVVDSGEERLFVVANEDRIKNNKKGERNGV